MLLAVYTKPDYPNNGILIHYIHQCTVYMVIFDGRKFCARQVWKDFCGLFFRWSSSWIHCVSLRHYFFEDDYFAVNKCTAKSAKFIFLENYRVYGIFIALVSTTLQSDFLKNVCVCVCVCVVPLCPDLKLHQEYIIIEGEENVQLSQ